jgi:hypothetical protein
MQRAASFAGKSAMSPEATIIYDHVCDAVRKSFRPDIKIEFAPGESRFRDTLMETAVFAHVYDDSILGYDRDALLALISGTLERATGTEAVITGAIDGKKYRLHIAVSASFRKSDKP